MKRYFNSLWTFTEPEDLVDFIKAWKQGDEDLPGDPLELPLDFQLDDLESALEDKKGALPVVAVECWHGSEITVTPISLEIYEVFQEDGMPAAVLLDKLFFTEQKD